jgi:hypothetical protein
MNTGLRNLPNEGILTLSDIRQREFQDFFHSSSFFTPLEEAESFFQILPESKRDMSFAFIQEEEECEMNYEL